MPIINLRRCFLLGSKSENELTVRSDRRRLRQGRYLRSAAEPLETRVLLAAYPLFARWTETATNGSGLQQGDPTTLTWSFPADGITTENSGGLGNGGAPNNLRAFLDKNWGTGPGGSDLTLRPWFKYFDESLNRIGSIAGLNFVYLAQDDGALIRWSNKGIAGTRADIRITGRSIDGEPNGANVAAACAIPFDGGDMTFDTDNVVTFTDSTNDYRILRNVLMHELGHGIGLDHVASSESDLGGR